MVVASVQEIVFFDTEIDSKSGRILDIGAIKNTGSQLHTAKHSEFAAFIRDSNYICGHNIMAHDLK